MSVYHFCPHVSIWVSDYLFLFSLSLFLSLFLFLTLYFPLFFPLIFSAVGLIRPFICHNISDISLSLKGFYIHPKPCICCLSLINPLFTLVYLPDFPFRIVQLGPLSFCFSGLNLPVLHFSPGFLFRRSAWASLFLFVWVIPLSPVSCSWIFVLCSAWASVCLFVWVNPLCPVFCSWIFCSVGHFEGAVCLCCWIN